MKKLVTLAVLGLVLSGCTKGFDMPEPTPEPTPDPTGVTDEEIKANVEKVFGTTFSPNHDWNSTTNGTVTLKFNSSVKKVAVLASLSLTSDEGNANSMKVLNQVETNNQTSVNLSYDAPSASQALYAAFYTASGCMFKKIESNTVTMDQAPAKTRGETEVYKIPEGEFAIGKIEESWAAQRNWIPDEKLYMLADDDYSRMKMDAPAFSKDSFLK